jgi:thiol-disulfide isomerase/thioredoxin
MEAAETGRPLFLKFGSEWCGPCRKLDSTTMRDPKVVASLNAGFIPVKLDGDKESRSYGFTQGHWISDAPSGGNRGEGGQ